MYKVISDHKEFLVISKDPGVSFHKEDNNVGLHEKNYSNNKREYEKIIGFHRD